MGYARWDSGDWDRFTATTKTQTTQQTFASSSMKKTYDPKFINLREARDSAKNPDSTPIVVALDVTGSMGEIAGEIARQGLGEFMTQILAKTPVTDPQVMFMAVGDAYCDSAPLQVTQFEPDIKAAEQLKELWLEGNGGGNGGESYSLPYYFAAKRTALDCTEKTRRKGILFTVGDEPVHSEVTKDQIARVFGDEAAKDLSSAELLAMAKEKFDVYHVLIEKGYGRSSSVTALNSWTNLIGKDHIIPLADHTKIGQALVAVIEAHEGKAPQAIIAAADKADKAVITRAIANVKANTETFATAPAPVSAPIRPKAGATGAAPVAACAA